MDRLTHSIGRSKHLEQNLSRLVLDTSNNKPTSISQNQTAPPTLQNIAEKNGIKLYPFIQQSEYKYKDLLNSSETDSSSIVESSSSSDEDDSGGLKKAVSEITLSSRPTSTQKKNMVAPYVEPSTHFFEQMPGDVIRKMLFENFIDLNDIPATAKNLMVFAGVSKSNREFVRELLTEEGMHEVSFEITKSVIPNLLATLANDKKAKFTQIDVDRLVHDWPYLTFDCSYAINKDNFTNQGLQVLKKIVCHPGLKEIRINSNPYVQVAERNDNYLAFNNIGLDLIYSLLSRKSSTPLKVDFKFINWVPPLDYKFQINENSVELIKKIQNRADKCKSVIFGSIDLRRSKFITFDLFINNLMSNAIHNRGYQFNYVKMMCNIALTHSARTISLANLQLSDSELGLILDEIQLCDKSSLEYLQLAENDIYESAVQSLSELLQSKNTCLRFIEFGHREISDNALNILAVALKNNHSLEAVYIHVCTIAADHPIRNDGRVILIENL